MIDLEVSNPARIIRFGGLDGANAIRLERVAGIGECAGEHLRALLFVLRGVDKNELVSAGPEIAPVERRLRVKKEPPERHTGQSRRTGCARKRRYAQDAQKSYGVMNSVSTANAAHIVRASSRALSAMRKRHVHRLANAAGTDVQNEPQSRTQV